MNSYIVTIQATIRKDLTVEAENEQEASEIATELFNCQPEPPDSEHYEQDVLEIRRYTPHPGIPSA